jgi:hypothetical protein
MIVAKNGNYVRKFMWQLCVKSVCNDIKKNQMHAYEMSYK